MYYQTINSNIIAVHDAFGKRLSPAQLICLLNTNREFREEYMSVLNSLPLKKRENTFQTFSNNSSDIF